MCFKGHMALLHDFQEAIRETNKANNEDGKIEKGCKKLHGERSKVLLIRTSTKNKLFLPQAYTVTIPNAQTNHNNFDTKNILLLRIVPIPLVSPKHE
ncbi:hypothetical protein Glove_668g37 [Diversispora epigaea]|uniref:Uncharacterized protein n=1 Tax=Diversispora epigaea TaxID=1348612 RepID=A0A397G705_9GLOM|nr:hypothetical protein Glove_668g37 [Diversispora epigaea]